MRAEEKQLDEGREHDLVPAQEIELDELEHELAPIIEELRDEQREVVLGAMRAIFARDTILISGLALPKRELEALAYLQAAVSGKQELGRFVFAEDRRDLLEQALAILQPNLQIGIAELVGPLDVLRTELTSLEDAQEELYDWEKAGLAEHAPPGDKPPDDGTAPVPTGPAEDTSLDGPERVIAKPGSTLDGEPLPDEPPAASTLSDEPPPAPPAPTTPGKPAGRGGRRG